MEQGHLPPPYLISCKLPPSGTGHWVKAAHGSSTSFRSPAGSAPVISNNRSLGPSGRRLRRIVRSAYSNVKLSRYKQEVASDRAEPRLMSNQRTRDLKRHWARPLAIASFVTSLAVCALGHRYGLRAVTMALGAQTDIVHFNLLGPDWAKVPEDYHGVLPEKVVAELNIPKEYVTHRTKLFAKLFGDQPSAKTVEDIPIAFSYPSMTGAADEHSFATAQNFAARIDTIIRPGSAANFRKGTHAIIFGNGKTREPRLDSTDSAVTSIAFIRSMRAMNFSRRAKSRIKRSMFSARRDTVAAAFASPTTS
jgi:hypothetical protein